MMKLFENRYFKVLTYVALFAIAFTHLWDMFQLFGGKSFITRVTYQAQTMLNLFICFGVVIGYVLNTKTNFPYVDIIEHFISGVVASYFAYDFAVAFQGRSRHLSPGLASLFALCFSCFILVGWEFYEFTMDRLYGYTLQVSPILSEDGLVVVVASLNMEEGLVFSGPDIVSRGFVYVKESGDLVEKTKRVAEAAISKMIGRKNTDINQLKTAIRDDVSRFIFKETKRKPMILPILMEV